MCHHLTEGCTDARLACSIQLVLVRRGFCLGRGIACLLGAVPVRIYDAIIV